MMTTADHKKAHDPKTTKKLAFEVAKCIEYYVKESKAQRGSVPWRLPPLMCCVRLIRVLRVWS